MEWFQSALERRNKSVVSNANRAVNNMAGMMQKQNSRLSKLESVVKDFENIAVDSLQGEINSLEKRKMELALELDTIELTLQSRRAKLEEVMAAMRSLNSTSSLRNGNGADKRAADGLLPSSPRSSSGKSTSTGRGDSQGDASPRTDGTGTAQPLTIFTLSAASRPSPDEDELEMDYMEEVLPLTPIPDSRTTE